jgi:hypothetical protein
MSRYRFELATPADDGELRAVSAATPMPGTIALSFRREPSYFAAAVVDGRFRQVVAARDWQSNRIVGFGSRSVGARYVNGRPAEIGYLSSLRFLEAHRGLGLLARGYAFFRKLHEDGRTPLYLTTIASDNRTALAVLTSGRAGLPRYHFAGRYRTAAIRLSRARKAGSRGAAVEIRPARVEDLPAVLDFLSRVGPRRQFFPCYEAGDFFSDQGAFRDLAAEDLLLAFREGHLMGTLAGWDQYRFRQMVVHGYGGLLRRMRPLYNVWAGVRGLPRLPPPNEPVRYLIAALPLVADDDPIVCRELLSTLLRRKSGGPWKYLLVGMHESDPLLAAVRRHPAVWYTTNLYLVCWQDGERFRRSLDDRSTYLELGSL